MLKIATSLGQLNIEQFLGVYRESSLNRIAENRLLDYLREDFFPIQGAVCALWVAEGRYVAALRLEPYRDGYLISGLETPPEERRKGYGESLVQAVVGQYNAPIYSHIAKNINVPSFLTLSFCPNGHY